MKNEVGGACSTYGVEVFGCEKPEVKRPRGRTKHRGDDNVDVKAIAWKTCTGLLWLRMGTSCGLL